MSGTKERGTETKKQLTSNMVSCKMEDINMNNLGLCLVTTLVSYTLVR